VRLGKHSKGAEDKWNTEHRKLIVALNELYPQRLQWIFMGGSAQFNRSVSDIPNVILYKESEIPVIEYLKHIDIFLFFPAWSRQEPWARVIGEAMAAAKPIVAMDASGGTKSQVIHGNNGFLCKDLDDFIRHLSTLIESPKLIETMGRNSAIYARFFTSEQVVNKLMLFWGLE